MPLSSNLTERCHNKCELCAADSPLTAYAVPASPDNSDDQIAVCTTCNEQIASGDLDINHWRSLTDSMWNPTPAVQVMAWRMLKQLDTEAWAQDALDILYLEDSVRDWAEAAIILEEDNVIQKDANGAILNAGDNVVIIKDLDVKGTSFVAKRGTAVRGISLTSNPEHIEGRVNGTRIVILTKYVKKS